MLSRRPARPHRNIHRYETELVGFLESRLLMCADGSTFSNLPADVGWSPAQIVFSTPQAATSSTTSTGTVAAATALSAVPVLDSRVGASAKLYLDFNGDTTGTWGQYAPGTTPAYDQDGNTANFSDSEVASIREIWARVSEKYSPFNIDVTTVDPGTYSDRQVLRVVVGGSGSWLGAQAGGVSYVGSFANSAPNTAYVFPSNLANGNAKYVAEAASHEAGHGFGLQHQGTWSGTTLTNEYNPGSSAAAPVMGASYSATRGLWWRGTTSASSTSVQDDMAVISNSTNGFGYRPDEAGNTTSAAAVLGLSGTTVSGAGVITTTGDADVYSFNSGAGAISLTAGTVTGATLDLKLDVRNSAGTVIASADTSSLGETISTTIPAGTYYLTVSSHGSYGDVGQYTLSGNVVAGATPTPTPSPTPTPTPTPTVPAAPASLSATAASTSQINLTWADVASETGYLIERSTNGTTGWTSVGTVGANVTTFQNTGLPSSTRYYYRVIATNSVGSSTASAIANATTNAVVVVSNKPAAPSNMRVSTVTGGVLLQWNDNSTNETGFRVYYSTNNSTWYALGTLGANKTSATVSGLSTGRTYYFKVRAYNSYGESPDSNAASLVARSASRAGTVTSVARSLFSSTPIDAVTALRSHSSTTKDTLA